MLRSSRIFATRLRGLRTASFATASVASNSVNHLLSQGKPHEAARRILEMQSPGDLAAAGAPNYLQTQILQKLGTSPSIQDLDLALGVFNKLLDLSKGVDKFSCARLSLLCINAGYPHKALEPWARLLEVLGEKVSRAALDKILDRPEFEPAAVAALAAYFIVSGTSADPATAQKLVPRKVLPASLYPIKNLGGIASEENRKIVLRGIASMQKHTSANFSSPAYLDRVAVASFADTSNMWSQVQLASEPAQILEVTYAAFMRRFSETRQTEKAFKLWQTMIESGVAVTTHGWAALLKTALHAPENTHAIFFSLWDRMLAGGFKPDAECWLQRLLLLTGRNGSFDQAIKEFATLQQTPEVLDIKCVNVMVLAYARRRNFAEAEALLKWAAEHDLQPTAYTYNALIQASINSPTASLRYLTEMNDRGIAPDIVTYTFVAEQMLRRGQPIGELLAEMKQRGIEPNEQFNTVIAYGIGHNTKDINVARQTLDSLLQQRLPVSLQTLGAFIQLELSYGDVDRAVHYMSLIDKFGLTPNVPTYNQLIRGALTRNRLDVAEATFKKMTSGRYRRILPNTYTFTFLLQPWTAADLQNRTDVRQLVRLALQAIEAQPDSIDYQLARQIKKIATSTGSDLVSTGLAGIVDEKSVNLFDRRKVPNA